MITGDMKDQFGKIRNYCAELLRTNPGSTVNLKLKASEDGGELDQFHRLYICLAACKEGFKYCRKVIGVDGCFLKGQQGGQLLTAVGIDANNSLYPIAWAVVEVENKDTWLWFLEQLGEDLGIENQCAYTFMSDKQKGLIPAFEELFPDADNRFCVRHLHSNMKKDGFKIKMQELFELDEDAYTLLNNKPPSQWSRSHFSPLPRCDVLLNNMCECFNSLILNARDKPIITMLEIIRNIVMTRYQILRDKARAMQYRLPPKIRGILDKTYQLAGGCVCAVCDDLHFQIQAPTARHNVDLDQKSCSCRRWDLTGLPCMHAVSAIWTRNEDPEDYVHDFYLVSTWLKSYEPVVYGTNSEQYWPVIDLPPPLPPVYEKKPGRPKKLRRRQPDEPPAASNATKLRRFQKSTKCGKCGILGHNARTCKNDEAGTSKKRPRPKKSRSNSTSRASTQEVSNSAPYASQTPNINTASVSHTRTASNSTRIGSTSRKGKEKLSIRRKSVGVKVGGRSTVVRNMNVSQGSNIKTPVIVKGGTNFITLANLRAAFGNQTSEGGSGSGSGMNNTRDGRDQAKRK